MSLEAAIEKLNGNIEKLVAQNEEIIGIAKARQAGGAAAETKTEAAPKKATAKAKAKEEGSETEEGAITKTVLTDGLKTWLNEFGKPEEHPESAARHGALKTVLGKVGGDGFNLKTLAEDDQEKITKLHNWLENTAKKADKGHGIGRLAADPVAEGDGDGDDLGV